ncbi:MAG: ribonuclease HII [Candidatus Bilamarchaeaceae archaeon]
MSSTYVAGIDEAGRGAVIGPLVICCALCNRRNEKRLRQLCKKDSKKLTPAQREKTLKELKEFCEFKWIEVSAADINKLMEKMNLNDIEALAMASLAKQIKSADIMIDMPDRYSRTFNSRMKKFGCERFEAEHKADEKYPIVAAASICAKVIRDEKIEKIKKELAVEFGSGYPGDDETRKALRNKETRAKLTPVIRQKWKTLESIKQRKLFESE